MAGFAVSLRALLLRGLASCFAVGKGNTQGMAAAMMTAMVGEISAQFTGFVRGPLVIVQALQALTEAQDIEQLHSDEW
eukprot:gene5258-22848_t